MSHNGAKWSLFCIARLIIVGEWPQGGVKKEEGKLSPPSSAGPSANSLWSASSGGGNLFILVAAPRSLPAPVGSHKLEEEKPLQRPVLLPQNFLCEAIPKMDHIFQKWC